METDPKKLLALRLRQPRMSSEEFYAQMERSLKAASQASQASQTTKRASSEPG